MIDNNFNSEAVHLFLDDFKLVNSPLLFLLKSKLRARRKFNHCASSFDDFKLQSSNILQRIELLGFEKPSYIHRQCIEPMMAFRYNNNNYHDDYLFECYYPNNYINYIGACNNYIGVCDRIISYSIAIVERINMRRDGKAIVIGNRSNWAIACINYLLKYFGGEDLKVYTSLGIEKENDYDGKENVIVGTQQSVCDLINRIKVDCVELLVIDGSNGDDYSIQNILRNVKCQVFWFNQLNQKFQENNWRSIVTIEKIEADYAVCESGLSLSHFYIDLQESWKFATIYDLLNEMPNIQALIYISNEERAISISEQLKKHFTVSCLHTNLEKSEAELMVNEFRNGLIPYLITTDKANKKFSNLCYSVRVIINYDIPWQNEFYSIRNSLGRRYARNFVISLATRAERTKMLEIERFYEIDIQELPHDFMNLIGN